MQCARRGVGQATGTVGAAATAINEGVPAIAVSTEGSRAASYPFNDTADFVVDLLDSLHKHSEHGQLLPSGTGLNVNYPLVNNDGEPQGVELTNTGLGFIDLAYANAQLPAVGEESTFTTRTARIPETLKNADTTALDEDKVSVTLITGTLRRRPKQCRPRPGRHQRA